MSIEYKESQQITPGDYVLYPIRWSSYISLHIGQVLEVLPKKIKISTIFDLWMPNIKTYVRSKKITHITAIHRIVVITKIISDEQKALFNE
jgi:hypothetical protein